MKSWAEMNVGQGKIRHRVLDRSDDCRLELAIKNCHHGRCLEV